MIEQVLTVDNFPTWALSALINGDYSGLSYEDGKLVDEFINECVQFTYWDVDLESLDSGNFTRYPAFGLATDCCTVRAYAVKGIL